MGSGVMAADDNTAEVHQLLQSLFEDVLELVRIVKEENYNMAYTTIVETKEDVVRTVKTLVGEMVLTPTNYVTMVDLATKIGNISGKFLKVNVDVLTLTQMLEQKLS